ncbi:hypothetical protein DVB37_22455 [Achromobacter sp. B7]|uniref:2OG-Fe(II) oxygenase n=1 Tax=Achromobacter sp. B7 TaxID=2282475 RepID=UPI000E76FA47|nr:2OG-Fe(II) oxygenase [Achromobacter sp. B7]AYD66373.1 hypothetical protein DVB37_22455 [Achromobacter sp. B7]
MLSHAQNTRHATMPDPTPPERFTDTRPDSRQALHRPLDHTDWAQVFRDLDAQGWALLPGLFAPDAARRLVGATVPPALAAMRPVLYRHLLPIARAWSAALQLPAADPNVQPDAYPDDFTAWTQRNRDAGQTRPLSAVRTLTQGDYQALTHHDNGKAVFGLQLVALLSEPDVDFTGGEFVMTEQRPRMQSRPMVLPLKLGDAAVIAVSHRPVQGAQGIYRVTARHAISRVRSGQRVGLELLLHDASQG